MNSSILKAKQDEFHDFAIDVAKKAIFKGEQVVPMIALFDGAKVWPLPFCPRDFSHKKILFMSVAAAMAAKNIKRYAYVFDAWSGEINLTNHGYTGEAIKAMGGPDKEREIVAKIRATLPDDLSQWEFKGQTLIYGRVNSEGPEHVIMQKYDDKTRRFEKSVKMKSSKDGNFENLLKLASQARWPSSVISKDELWSMTMKYFDVNKPIYL